jgi:hypothetical protein
MACHVVATTFKVQTFKGGIVEHKLQNVPSIQISPNTSKFKYVGVLPWAPGGGWLYFILTAMKVCFYKK